MLRRSFIVVLFAGLAVVVAGGSPPPPPGDKSPVQRFGITIPADQFQEYVAQLKSFANAHGFSFQSAQNTWMKEDTLFQMERSDMEIIACTLQ